MQKIAALPPGKPPTWAAWVAEWDEPDARAKPVRSWFSERYGPELNSSDRPVQFARIAAAWTAYIPPNAATATRPNTSTQPFQSAPPPPYVSAAAAAAVSSAEEDDDAGLNRAFDPTDTWKTSRPILAAKLDRMNQRQQRLMSSAATTTRPDGTHSLPHHTPPVQCLISFVLPHRSETVQE